MERLVKNKKGITLISLVITIILLIILAGIGINLSLGENGLFNKAKYAKNKYLNAQRQEEEGLNELYEKLGLLGELPENTKETEAGKIVRMPNTWETILPTYVSDKDGSEVVQSKKVASVYAVSAGNGNTIPVPLGFYYVGGTIESGVVISDNKEDQNKYAGKEDVSKELKGNQFVWIPCTINEYNKIDWGKESAKWPLETNTIEYMQIEKYSGFYIGRYEAGVATLNKETNEFENSVTFNENASLYEAVTVQTGIDNWGWQNYNFTARKEGASVITGTNKTIGNITVKADSIPYYHSDYYTAVEMSERLYSKHSYVKSTLVTGTMWDMMMKYMQKQGTDVTSSNLGNYSDTTLEDCTGWYCQVDGTGNTKQWQENTTKNNKSGATYTILTTGATEQVKKNNIYDVSGNVSEWTNENSYMNNMNYGMNSIYNSYIIRGGNFRETAKAVPPCFRACDSAISNSTTIGFRAALYIK